MVGNRLRRNGFSLVEMLIAIAILGTVMLTIITLFFMGRRNVYSGKQMTRANAVGTRVLEDLSYMTADDVISNFGLTNSTTLAANPVGGTSYNASAVVSTASPGTNTYLLAWQGLVPAADIQSGVVSLVITPTNPSDGTKPVTTANFLRLNVVVTWTEPPAHTRSVAFATAKAKRP